MISSRGCECLGDVIAGSVATRAWIPARPETLRSCRWRSMRLIPGCCAWAICSAKPLVTISTANVMVRVVFMWTAFRLQVCVNESIRRNGGAGDQRTSQPNRQDRKEPRVIGEAQQCADEHRPR